MHPEVVGQVSPRFARELERVAYTGKALGKFARKIDPAPARIGKRDQMGRKIAAVDGRHVSRVQRPQIARVIPIVEVTAEPLETIHGRKRGLPPFDEVEGTRPAKVARADGG